MKIKVYVDSRRPATDGKMPVCLSVNFKGERFFINTGLFTTERFSGETFPNSQSNHSKKSRTLGKMLIDTESYIILHQHMTPKELKDAIRRDILNDTVHKPYSPTLKDMVDEYSQTLEKDGTREIYRRTVVRIEDYDKSVTVDEIDTEWLNGFKSFLLRDLKINTAAIYMRNIKTTVNWMQRKGMTTNNPFMDFKIPTEIVSPNNIPVERLRRFLEYPCDTWQEPYRDFFKLSLLLAGINAVDLLTMPKDALSDGYISFIRTKTNKQNAQTIRHLKLPVFDEVQEILDKYRSREGWLLSFMDCRSNYTSFVRECNDALKKIGPTWKSKDKAGKLRKIEHEPICPNISMYSARYSFGSIAVNDLDISEHAVAMCLGHSWAKNVTSHYIANDQRKIDRTVRRVTDYILYNKE